MQVSFKKIKTKMGSEKGSFYFIFLPLDPSSRPRVPPESLKVTCSHEPIIHSRHRTRLHFRNRILKSALQKQARCIPSWDLLHSLLWLCKLLLFFMGHTPFGGSPHHHISYIIHVLYFSAFSSL